MVSFDNEKKVWGNDTSYTKMVTEKIHRQESKDRKGRCPRSFRLSDVVP